MLILKRLFPFIAFSFISLYLPAQSGAPLLSHYKESMEIENQNWAICQDENNVMMFANRRGILTFDGQTWNFIRIPVIPYALEFNPGDKKVYVGGENNYGYLQRDEMGFYRFFSLLDDSSHVGLISKIIFTDATVYFYSEKSISRHDIMSGELQMRLWQKDNQPFTGMFITPKNTFINVLSSGLFRLESDTLFPIVTGYLLENDEVLFSLPYDNRLVLLGKGDGSLLLFDGIKFYYYPIKDEGYLKQNILSDGLDISDSLYAFSTLEGGALVVERKSGKPRYTINYLRGLPDDEVFALGTDNNNGLWLSHQYGLTRAELMLPISNFSVYPGLRGNLIAAASYNNELYVATSEGVFYLAEVKNYDMVEVLVRQEQTARASGIVKPEEKSMIKLQQQQQVPEAEKTRKGIFSRIFGKKTETPVAPQKAGEEVAQAAEAKPADTAPAKPSYVKKKISRFKSISWVFNKVNGLDDKCKQLVSSENGLLASTNKGLYLINSHTAKQIVRDRNINYVSSVSEDNRYYIAADDGYFYIQLQGKGFATGYPDRYFVRTLYSIVSSDRNTLWAGSDDEAIRITLKGKPVYTTYTIKSDFPQQYRVTCVNDTVFLFTETGVNIYDAASDMFVPYPRGIVIQGTRLGYDISQPDAPWIKNDNEWVWLNDKDKVAGNDMALLKMSDNIISIYTEKDNIWVINFDNKLYRVSRNKLSSIKPDLDLFIRSITNQKGDKFKISDIVFDAGDNNVYFDLVAPAYLKRNSTMYQYIVDEMMDDWSKWTTSSTINLMLPHGTYALHVRARDIWGNISEIKSLSFTIQTPFTQTTFFFILIIVIAVFTIIAIIRFRERQLQKEKHILEEKVRERTSEIEAQKQEITSSIEYASRIQLAMLPMDELFSNSFSDYFILFRPRDIVSGDFYWIGEDDNHIFFTVADCTGHGVPGAFMSTLGISTLYEIITNKKNLRANTVLNFLREKIKKSLHQTGKEGEAADGMDLSLCVLHKNRKSLEFSGAYNSLIIFQGGEMKEYKGDRMPIGIYVGEKESFTNFEINVSRGDAVYLFSDGINDQFGGPWGEKYKKASFKKLLSEINHKPMDEQKQFIEAEFEKWKGDTAQIDDITVIGIRI